MWCGERLTKVQSTPRPYHVWPAVWTNIGKAAQNREKKRMEKRTTETPQCSKTERNLLHWSWWPRLQSNSKMRGENGKDPWHQAMPCKKTPRDITKVCAKWRFHPRRLQKRSMSVQWNLIRHGRLSSQECGVGRKVSKVQRTSRATRRHCKRRLWSLCSLYWTRFISYSNDRCKSDWCHCKTTRLWRTRSRRSIRLHSGKNGGWSSNTETSKVWMSRLLDASSTSQVVKILVKYRRPSGSYRTKYIYGHPLAGLFWERPYEEVRLEFGRKQVPIWECLFVHKTRIVLVGKRGWHTNGWKEEEYGSHVEEIDEKRWSRRINFVSWSPILGMYSLWMWTE